jgi:hypothetical protein
MGEKENSRRRGRVRSCEEQWWKCGEREQDKVEAKVSLTKFPKSEKEKIRRVYVALGLAPLSHVAPISSPHDLFSQEFPILPWLFSQSCLNLLSP